MKIATIGSGNMGGTLGRRWAAVGHRVTFGSREPNSEKMRLLLQASGPQAEAATIREAVERSDVILLAVMAEDIERALSEAGDLKGKLLINCTICFDGTSADAKVRSLVRDARVVRAFHNFTWEVLANPCYEGGRAAAFLSGDDPEAVAVVASLATDIGLDAIDVGDPESMAKVEAAVGMLWGVLGSRFGREYSLGVLRR
ncbi:NAD(P)-binding domain-containing protein [Cohnella thailandensis]|uniref:NAD(P)-binding domain-containing protein n=1 Tax=Cohnella thailandensis TaxID=557557 RepID=A0A841SZ33_9BACL|nr:NAD(P)-binding domain-containing protein [Cohnella thailandensis]MBP1977494.1 putative dinucleotide-binding enzyme [Cohnella thailandensis]